MKNNWLLDYREKVTSQSGEDGILKKIFEVMNTEKGWCVEFGAWDGKFLSNCRSLILNGWNAVLIEADKDKFRILNRRYKHNDRVICINKFIRFRGEDGLDNTLLSIPVPKDFDLLSIDIDGNDYYVWGSLRKFRPKVVVIEYNPTIPNDIEFVQRKCWRINHGNSLLSITKLAKSKGYKLVCATGNNAIYVRSDYYSLFGIEDNSIDEINTEGEKYKMKLFQLYDGTLVLGGCNKLLWKNKKIRSRNLQILPKEERFFGDRINN